ncbi:glycoside hydrolase family 47 protein [Aplosporella prunicola CBS 121167]|uniref:alpha-1,2-Mannosidase n=1 Tax=Aplosporella prunicola CBS 121167 TaxID=1176127 RepID=A0A6A6BJF4_9PEZI|nr:glycoside hydrolase family 47 protein [Aplosporella prunicola CBS 121167]KAF2144289.1 glycoside hydrolase family 47 protein [Aplosporella prunicola CBS 121167]
MPLIRRSFSLAVAFFTVVAFFHLLNLHSNEPISPVPLRSYADRNLQKPVQWKDVPERYPLSTFTSLPAAKATSIPKIQYDGFLEETLEQQSQREARQQAVKASFLRSWHSYKTYAWLQDELTPLSGNYKNTFGGWGASLVDALDTLWIMGLHEEFEIACKGLKKIDFTTTDMISLNIFETTIRYLGGLLSANDLSGGKYPILKEKALELGEMLYRAFDTPNRMPVSHWNWRKGADHEEQRPSSQAVSAEVGSLSLEFTRLSQLTGDPKYYDAVQRIADEFEAQQNDTKIPGLWPIIVNPRKGTFTDDRRFTFGGMSDSLYEYFPKQYLLLGGVMDQYRYMYEGSIEAAKKYMFWRPLNKDNKDILISGTISNNAANEIKLDPEGQHLGCFVGGMVGIAAKIFDRPDEVKLARQLTDGCIWAYESMPTGIMPEIFHAVPCTDPTDCLWSEERWIEGVRQYTGKSTAEDALSVIERHNLPYGFTDVRDKRYLLRPEAIESVFIMYRITGDRMYQEKAWKMFKAVERATRTEISNAAINNVNDPEEVLKVDSCESFWMAETLKYYYLIFSEPELISLDQFVFNTEAHPLRRPASY